MLKIEVFFKEIFQCVFSQLNQMNEEKVHLGTKLTTAARSISEKDRHIRRLEKTVKQFVPEQVGSTTEHMLRESEAKEKELQEKAHRLEEANRETAQLRAEQAVSAAQAEQQQRQAEQLKTRVVELEQLTMHLQRQQVRHTFKCFLCTFT